MDADSSDTDFYFPRVKFGKRWECHKYTIARLYVKDMSMKELAERMKTHYHFDASVRQYRQRLKRWKIAKKISSATKEKIVQFLGKRTQDGVEAAALCYNGVEMDHKLLCRYLQSSALQQPEFCLSGIVFSRWNLPCKALRNAAIHHYDAPSPFQLNDSTTSSDVVIFSLPMTNSFQRNASLSGNASSRTVAATIAKMYDQKARNLLEGQLQGLFSGMSVAESKRG